MLEDAGGRIDYAEEGSGPAVLLVPGSWATRSAWRGVIAALGGGVRAVTTSLSGYGATEERRTATDASTERQAEIIEAVVRHIGGRVHLVGHSYGGVVCLAVAIRGIAPLASLTVIEAVTFGLLRKAGDHALFQQFMTTREDYFRAFESGDKQAARGVVDYLGGAGSFDALPQRMRDYIVATTPAHVLDMRSPYDAPLSAYEALSLPCLVVRGARGIPAVARTAEILSRTLPNASLATVAGAGHFVIATHAGELAGLIGDHVSKAEARA